jgi:DHA3 family macrolide efflux protein-like MFS transporter
LPSPLRRQLALLQRAASFRLLWFATLGSGIGTWMATIALAQDVKNRTDSTWWVSGMWIAVFLPSVVVGLTAGPLIDRLSRKRLLIGADLARMGVFVTLPFVTNAAEIIVLAAVVGVGNSFFRPAVLAGVPNLVADEDLAHGTALLQATDWAAATAGPLIGGILTSTSAPHLVYWINAATFLFSAIMVFQIPAMFLHSRQAISRGHWRDIADGLGAFKRSPPMRTVLFALGIAQLAIGLVNTSEIFLAEDALHRGPFGWGLFWSASGLGLVIGSLAVGSILEGRNELAVYPLAYLPWAAGILGAAIAPNIWVGAFAMAVNGFGNGLAFPISVLIIQRHTSDLVRGRAFTVIISAHNALLGIGIVSAGGLAAAVGARWTFGIAAALFGAASLTALVLGRGLRTSGVVAQQTA